MQTALKISIIAAAIVLSGPAIAKPKLGPMPPECEARWAPPWALHFHDTDERNARRCAPWFRHVSKKSKPHR